MLTSYYKQKAEREKNGLPPLPLNLEEIQELIKIIESNRDEEELIALLENEISPGVDETAYVKAGFLKDIALEKINVSLITPPRAISILGTMLGGYSVEALVEILKVEKYGNEVVEALKSTILVYDSFNDIFDMKDKNDSAQKIINSWSDAEWFTSKENLPDKIPLKVYKVDGETNTDDFSPAKEAWSRPDIPLHAQAFLKFSENIQKPLEVLEEFKSDGSKLVFVGDVVGTGSSRKSAVNSMLWHIGDEIPYVPAKKTGGFCLGGKIAPIFYNTLQDSGAFPLELDVSSLKHGQKIVIEPYNGIIKDDSGKELVKFEIKNDVIFDEVKAGGRINLIIGRQLTDKTREKLNLPPSNVFRRYGSEQKSNSGFTLAQKMVGKACGMHGVRAGEYIGYQKKCL